MGRKGLVHPRTYLRNETQNSAIFQNRTHLRHYSTAGSYPSPPSKAVDSRSFFSLKCADTSQQKKHARHYSTTPRKPELSPLMSHRSIEVPDDSENLLVSQKLAQLYPRFMVGSACVSSKRRRYWKSKKARDAKNCSPLVRSSDDSSPCRMVKGVKQHEERPLSIVAVTDPGSSKDETETEGDDESLSQVTATAKITDVSEGDIDDDSDDDDDDDDCVLYAPQPVRVSASYFHGIEESDNDGDDEECDEDEELDEEDCPTEEVGENLFAELPSPVLEAILRHSDICTRYALGYTCVRWNKIAINSGIEWCSHHHDVIENLLLKEAEHPPVENYALVHSYITPMLRLAYADWLCNIARDTDQPSAVLPLAFRLFDITLSSVERFPLPQLQALAATCFWIASKVRGNGMLVASDMCVFSGGLLAAKDICALERFIMNVCDFHLLPPITRDFLELYLENSTRLLSTGYEPSVGNAEEMENMLCTPNIEFDEWAENVRRNSTVTVADCMSFLETLALHLYSFAPCQPSVLSAAIFSVSVAIVTGTVPLRSAFIRFATHAFLIEDPAVSQCCSLIMSTCVMIQEIHECKFLRTAFPAFFPQCMYTEE